MQNRCGRYERKFIVRYRTCLEFQTYQETKSRSQKVLSHLLQQERHPLPTFDFVTTYKKYSFGPEMLSKNSF